VAFDSVELREAAEQDKNYAGQLTSAVSEKLAQPIISLAGDITGSPAEAEAFNLYKQAEQLALQGVQRTLFFARVDVTRDSHWKKGERLAMLVSKARTSIGTDGEGWEVLSWTSPITSDLLDKPIGEVFEFQAARGHKPVRYQIETSAKFEQIAPTIRNAKFVLRSGEVFVEDETHLVEGHVAPARPKRRYEAQKVIGLGEIIVLADAPQRAAMHLPFRESVLIEGPPGSGKTSVGIMRIPCLIDRQWEELGLDRIRSEPFHTNSSMRILVLNDEMVGYLDSLVRSLNIEGVPVQTVRSFLRAICRDARTLSGRETRESGPSAHVKAHPKALDAYWAGFAQHVNALFSDPSSESLAPLHALGGGGIALLDDLRKWAEGARSIRTDGQAIPPAVNLASRVDEWVRRAARVGRPQARDGDQDEAARIQREGLIRDLLRDLWPRIFDWIPVAKAMFATAEYRKLLDACSEEGLSTEGREAADNAWREQIGAAQPQFSEYDAALAAWLGVHVALAPWSAESRPFVASQADRLTHVLIDEAQDLWPAHVRCIEKTLAAGGNLTLVGDLRQRLKDVSGLREWGEFGIPDLKRAAFGVNYRQSKQLGSFVHAFHERLYDESPVWKPSEERDGPVAQIHEVEARRIAAVTAEHVRRWRTDIAQATVGVIYDGRWTAERLKRFCRKLEDALQDTLTEVHLATRATGSAILRRTDCVIVVSAVATKGLEFDAVVFVDPHTKWDEGIDHVSIRRRNGLYVAISRARHALSLVMRSVPEALHDLAGVGLCEIALADDEREVT
jgi:DNA helicase IV